MQQAIIFDLDDTLIDTRQRHYLIFSNFVTVHGGITPTFEDYVLQRKSGTLSNKTLLQNILPGHEAEFEKYWLQSIESEEYLAADTPIVNINLLARLKNTGIKTMVLSLRSNMQTATNQVQSFTFGRFIDEFIFLKHSPGNNVKIASLSRLKAQNEILGFTGDTDYDKQAALEAGVNFFAVGTGMYTLQTGILYPDVNSVLENLLNR